ncbi:MAG: hypothetical protein GC134_03600 [Proteobacteria bacterium]|nr:hypothetical protein [Pseudomonadota bacterium]
MQTVAGFFLTGWFAVASLPWLLPLPVRIRLALYLTALPAAGFVGYLLDNHYMDKPHSAWSSPDFYLTLISIHAVFAAPSFIYWFSTRKKTT